MPEGFAFLFVLFFIGVVALIIYSIVQNKKRRDALTAWANQRGWRLDLGHDHSFDERFDQFKMLKSGSNRYAYEVLQGQHDGRDILAFRYHYETSSTDSKGNRTTTSHHFSAAILRLPFPMPELLIRPEGFFDKIGSFFGFDDIDFESAEFSRRYCVKCSDRRLAYDVITPKTIEFLLANPKYTIEAEGNHLLIINGRTWSPDQIDQALAVADGFLDRIPPGVIEQRREAASWPG